ncbi:MAG: RNA 2',3'-cyclic phosphodiesterase [Victivallaceae bacterium]|nr:RNA 2',3'-cyclic phosphodiesterase [Victivallaceae bacterium]
MEKARLFIAVDLPDGIREKIYRVCREIDNIRWAKQEQLHLTLRFIGDTDVETLPRLSEALEKLNFRKFILTLSGTGVFRPGIFFLEAGKSVKLFSLKKQIDEVLYNTLALEPEARSFLPHITLARFPNRPSREKSRCLTEVFETLFPLDFRVEEFVLYRSRLNSDGAIHIPLKKITGL